MLGSGVLRGMRDTVLFGDALSHLRTLPDNSIHCCVTSPPYWGLRDYQTPPVIFGGAVSERLLKPEGCSPTSATACDHTWVENRWYTEQAAGKASSEAFQEAGAANAQRVKDARWRNDMSCTLCGAWKGQLGLEPTPEAFIEHLVEIFREVRRVLHPSGTLWLNLGDSYAAQGGHRKSGASSCSVGRTAYDLGVQNTPHPPIPKGVKPKDLIGIPWMAAFALRADGWWLRSDIIWAKGRSGDERQGSCMPESVTDRPTKAHEHVFLLTKSERYYYDAIAVAEPLSTRSTERYKYTFGGPKSTAIAGEDGHGMGRTRPIGKREPKETGNLRDVWHLNPKPFTGKHFATMPPRLAETCIKAGTSQHGVCPHCNAPWERDIETSGGRDWRSDRMVSAGIPGERSHEPLNNVKLRTTIGWKPTCECPQASAQPAIVLDPFAGSGTTLAAAKTLRRDFVGIELNPDYAKFIDKRTQPTIVIETMRSLFDEAMRDDDELP